MNPQVNGKAKVVFPNGNTAEGTITWVSKTGFMFKVSTPAGDNLSAYRSKLNYKSADGIVVVPA